MKRYWWKILCVLILLYVIIGGILLPVPAIPKLNESARNLFFHVPMWYVMIVCFLVSAIYALRFLLKSQTKDDLISREYVNVGIVFGCMGMITGMEWANIAWGAPWSNDPKQVSALYCLAIYFAYLILRYSVKDTDKQARLSAVYNVFAFALLVPLLFIIPAHFKSLHPGTDSKPFEALYTQASQFRKISLPAMIGWILLGVWIFNLRIRTLKLQKPELFS
ncbi:MAG: cytochrome c biogenesis protein CcsA [Chitinophagaceae bacterium]|nr:cytochrome c biogenesis protein CcsA [Chitinophagaceae bacterium]